MKQVNDKFLICTVADRYKEYSINVIAKIGKDGNGFLYHKIGSDTLCEGHFSNYGHPSLESLKESLEFSSYNEEKGYVISIFSNNLYVHYVKSIKENNYADYFDIEVFSDPYIRKVYKSDNLKLKNGDYISCSYEQFKTIFFYDIDSLLNYLDENDILHYSNIKLTFDDKFKKFLERSFYSGIEKHQFKDFSGTFDDLDYCLENNLTAEDFDEWQAVQRMIKHKVDWETAKAISNTLYEKDISVFDCE